MGNMEQLDLIPNKEFNLICPDCGAKMVLRKSKIGMFYGCSSFPKCRTTQGAYPNGVPFKLPANKETRQWRIKAHIRFDTWYKSRYLTKNEAYARLANYLNLPQKEAHMGYFNIDRCQQVIKFTEEVT